MQEILQFLKKHGENLDAEIAAATNLSIAKVRLHLSGLAARKKIMMCHSVRFEKSRKVEGMTCRLAEYLPPASPGRKSKAQLKLS